MTSVASLKDCGKRHYYERNNSKTWEKGTVLDEIVNQLLNPLIKAGERREGLSGSGSIAGIPQMFGEGGKSRV